jgi:hypothetical protein
MLGGPQSQSGRRGEEKILDPTRDGKDEEYEVHLAYEQGHVTRYIGNHTETKVLCKYTDPLSTARDTMRAMMCVSVVAIPMGRPIQDSHAGARCGVQNPAEP